MFSLMMSRLPVHPIAAMATKAIANVLSFMECIFMEYIFVECVFVEYIFMEWYRLCYKILRLILKVKKIIYINFRARSRNLLQS